MFFRMDGPIDMIQLVEKPIDTTEVLNSVAGNLAGAGVLRLGTTREVTGGRPPESPEDAGCLDLA